MKKNHQVLNQMTQAETTEVKGGNIFTTPDKERLTLPKKPIRYYTQAIGEDGGDLPDLLTQ